MMSRDYASGGFYRSGGSYRNRKLIRVALASLMFVMILALALFGPPPLEPIWAWVQSTAVSFTEAVPFTEATGAEQNAAAADDLLLLFR
jgi:hypothetical protein